MFGSESGLTNDLASCLPERSRGRPRISSPSWTVNEWASERYSHMPGSLSPRLHRDLTWALTIGCQQSNAAGALAVAQPVMPDACRPFSGRQPAEFAALPRVAPSRVSRRDAQLYLLSQKLNQKGCSGSLGAQISTIPKVWHLRLPASTAFCTTLAFRCALCIDRLFVRFRLVILPRRLAGRCGGYPPYPG